MARLVTLVVLVALAVMVWSARSQGVWIDEIWSLWMSERGVPFATAFRERWMHDLHPPLFHASNWLAAYGVGPEIFQRRLLNFGPLLYLAAVVLFLWRRSPQARGFLLVLAAVLMTSRSALWFFPEHRSYFATLCLISALCAQLYDTFLVEDGGDARRDRWALAFLGVTILLALNLHYISTVFAGAVLAAAAAVHAFRRPPIARFVVMATAVAMVPLLAVLAGQLQIVSHYLGDFWINTPPLEAARMLVTTPGLAFGSNLVAAGCAVAVAGAALRRSQTAGAQAGGPLEVPAAAWWFAGALTLGLILASAFLAAVSLFKPILVPRYLIASSAIAVAILAALAGPVIARRRWLAALFCLNALALVVVFSASPLGNRRWSATLDDIQRVTKACPTTIVYGVDPSFVPGAAFSNEARIQNWGYQIEGRLHGFKVEILRADQATPPRFSAACPTLLWAEHVRLKSAIPQFLESPVATTPKMLSQLATASVYRGQSGFVFHIPPQSGHDAPVDP